MEKVSINEDIRLSPHFSLIECCKTKYKTADGNIPSHVAIENLRNICEGWLEDLRYSYNMLYGGASPDSGASPNPSNRRGEEEVPVIITSGYRSPEVNRLAGGSPNSNHLTGCAVDIRCMGKEQMIRYAGILLDIADGTKRDFDELRFEQRGSVCWLHFAVRPEKGGGADEQSRNRRRISFDIR